MCMRTFLCVVVLTTLSTCTNSMIPLRRRPHNGTATENITAIPDLALRGNDAMQKDKSPYYKEKGQLFKKKEDKILNTGEIEKQIIINIENHMKPALKILLGDGMLNNQICGNLNINCDPQYTTPLSERKSKIQSTTPNLVLTISLPHDSDEGISKSEESDDEHSNTSEKSRRSKPIRQFSEEIITESYSQATVYDSDEITTLDDINLQHRALSLSSGTKKHQNSITLKPVLETKRTTSRPTRISTKRSTKQPKPITTTATQMMSIGRESTESRQPKGTMRGTTNLIFEISDTSFSDKIEQNTNRMKPTTRKQTTKPSENVTDGISMTYPVSDESTTEMSESIDSY